MTPSHLLCRAASSPFLKAIGLCSPELSRSLYLCCEDKKKKKHNREEEKKGATGKMREHEKKMRNEERNAE
jgi:hypothetical protein